MRKIVEGRFAEDFGRLELKMRDLYQQGIITQADCDDFLRIKQRIISQSLDRLTQLLARTPWYVELKAALLKIYPGLDRLNEMSKDEARRYLKKMSAGRNRLSILAGDMSFLNVSNENGQHWQGDLLIDRVGKLLLEVFGEAEEAIYISRHGGDEFFNFSVDVSEETTRMMINRFLSAIRDIEVPNLKRYDLSPNMDFGSALFLESVVVLLDALERDIAIDKTYFNFLIDTTIVIADIRSAVNKGLSRIPLLMLLRERPDTSAYQHLKSFLIKGAGGISEEKLDELTLLFQKDIIAYHESVKEFVLSGVRQGADNELDAVIVDKALEPRKEIPFWRRILDAF